jgi:hypothetical protein
MSEFANLQYIPQEIFEKIWDETNIVDYYQIADLINRIPELKSQIINSVKRVDISPATLSRYIIDYKTIESEFPNLIEINLVDIDLKSLSEIQYLDKLHNCLIIMTPSPKEKDNIIDMLFKLHRKWGTNFIFEIYFLEELQIEDTLFFYILYDNGSFCLDELHALIEDETEEDFEYGSIFTFEEEGRIVVELSPKKILTYGSKDIHDILKYCEPEVIEFLPDILIYRSEFNLTLDQLLRDNAEMINKTYPNRLQFIRNTEYGEEPVISDYPEFLPYGKNIKCLGISIKEIRCPKKKEDNYNKYLEEKESEYFIYPDITVMELPLNSIASLYKFIKIFPNVKDFYLNVNPKEFEAISREINTTVPWINLHLV